MKMTQILSMRDDLFPTEAIDVLSIVQSSVPPMDYALIRKRIVEELGAAPEKAKALIQALKLVARDVMRNRDMDYRGVYDELKERMEEELDYELEAANIELFRKLYADDDEVTIPRVIHERTTRRVITLGYVDGYKIRDILAPGLDQALKDWVMLKLYEIT